MLYDQSKDYNRTGLNLLASAKYMEENGHIKHTLMDDKGRVCLQGALQAVVYGHPYKINFAFNYDNTALSKEFNDCILALALARNQTITPNYRSMFVNLVTWNNSPNTTGQDVIDLFRRAAEYCKLSVEASAA